MTEQKDGVAKTAAQLGFRNPYDEVLRTPASMDEAIDKLYGRIGQVDDEIYKLDAYSTGSRLMALSTKLVDVSAFNGDLGDQGESDEQIKFNYLLRLGTQLLYAESVDQRFAILKSHDAEGMFLTGAALDTFNMLEIFQSV